MGTKSNQCNTCVQTNSRSPLWDSIASYLEDHYARCFCAACISKLFLQTTKNNFCQNFSLLSSSNLPTSLLPKAKSFLCPALLFGNLLFRAFFLLHSRPPKNDATTTPGHLRGNLVNVNKTNKSVLFSELPKSTSAKANGFQKCENGNGQTPRLAANDNLISSYSY